MLITLRGYLPSEQKGIRPPWVRTRKDLSVSVLPVHLLPILPVGALRIAGLPDHVFTLYSKPYTLNPKPYTLNPRLEADLRRSPAESLASACILLLAQGLYLGLVQGLGFRV